MDTLTRPPPAAQRGPRPVQASRLPGRWLVAASAALVGSMLVGAMIGPASLGAWQVLGALLDALPLVELDTGMTDRQSAILWQLRVPRVVLGALVGATLAFSGAAYQGVFRNPLADPYLLGVAAGAGLGATLAIVNGGGAHPLLLPIAAFTGAVVGVAATYTLGRSVGGSRSTATIILAGVAVAAFLTALQTFVQQLHDDTLREVYTWILGRLVTTGWDDVILILPYVLVSAVTLLAHRRLLDVLAVGEEASTLGVRAERVRLVVVLAATLGTAAAVAVSGLIGFVGIIVPHTIRLIAGHSYRVLLPLSILLGGAFLVIADVLARTLLSPAELPIGVVTAFFGAPFFTVVLRTSKRGLM